MGSVTPTLHAKITQALLAALLLHEMMERIGSLAPEGQVHKPCPGATSLHETPPPLTMLFSCPKERGEADVLDSPG